MKYLLAGIHASNAINLFVFFVVSHKIGGDAINGKIENGHYFLSNHDHLTEVSASLFTYSKLHALILLVTFPMGLLVSACLMLLYWDKIRILK